MLCPASAHAQGGVPLWTNRYDGGFSNSREAIAVDSSGNVFVTGFGDFNYVIIAYSNLGLPLWTNRYDGPGNNWDAPSAIAVDNSGNVFVTGYSYSGSDFTSQDYATIAYSNVGVPLWTNRYDGPAQLADEATAIAVDSSGNVFVTGYSQGGSDSTFADYTTIAYSNVGVPLWTNRYDGPANGDDIPKAIAVDSSGNVFVSGRSLTDFITPINSDYATIAYSNSGEQLWENRYDRAGGNEAPSAIAVDSSGNVFVTGYSHGANDSWATVVYSSAGVRLWTRLYGGVDPSAIAVDRSGNVFVTGSPGTTIAYSNSGVPLWTSRGAKVAPSKMAVDRNGNVFVTGEYFGTLVTIKYSSSIPLPRLDFQDLNNQLVLSWTNAGFNLQSAPALSGTFTNIVGASSPYTNVTTRAQQFFRLISN